MYKENDHVRIKNTGDILIIKEVLPKNIWGVREYFGKIKYSLKEGYFFEHQLESLETPPKFLGSSKCECGAHKVHGRTCSYLYHSFWCPERKGKD